MIPFAIAGRRGLGSVRMRGVDVARKLGVPFFDLHQDWPEIDTLLLVKHWPNDILHRRRFVRRLIHDPLDSFWQTPHDEPVAYWRHALSATHSDVLLATSPAAAELMTRAGAPEVILAPHHADPRIGSDWYDPHGPVVYAGLPQFLGDECHAIDRACRRLGLSFLVDDRHDAWRSLQGASLVLAPRLGRSRTPLNTSCKPAVKVANAAQAGIPILATDDPAITSLVNVETFAGNWETAIAAAKQRPAPATRWTIEAHCELLQRVAAAD